MNVDEKKLIQSSATRWNSTYCVLDRLVEQRWPVVAVSSDESITESSNRHLNLSNEQWKLAEELIRILMPFEVATTVFCGEHHSTVSCTLPIVCGSTRRSEGLPTAMFFLNFRGYHHTNDVLHSPNVAGRH